MVSFNMKLEKHLTVYLLFSIPAIKPATGKIKKKYSTPAVQQVNMTTITDAM